VSLGTRDLEVRYANAVAVKATSLELERGELIGLIGPNGAGKTSLLKALAGMPALRDAVSWEGRPLAELDNHARARTIAYLPQSPQAYWPVSVRELVALGRVPHRRFGRRSVEADARAIAQALAVTGIDALADRPVDTLSGGEQMRAHLARAFAVDAPVLLVDEPVASLDPYHQLKVMGILDDYRRQGRLVIAVLHDLNLALAHCSRLLLMDAGRIVADGDPGDVIDADRLARHYRIRAWLTEHAGRRIAVPWSPLDQDV